MDPCEVTRSGFRSSCPPQFKLVIFDDILHCLGTIPDGSCELLFVDVALLDIDGKDHLAAIQQKQPFLHIIGMGHAVEIPVIVRLLKKGICDFVEKPLEFSTLFSKAMDILEEKNGIQLRKLTPNEKKIFHFILQGKTNKDMAKQMQKSIRTIEDHRSKLMKKLNSSNIVELTKCGIGLGNGFL